MARVRVGIPEEVCKRNGRKGVVVVESVLEELHRFNASASFGRGNQRDVGSPNRRPLLSGRWSLFDRG